MYDEIKVAVLQGGVIFMMWTNKNLYNIRACWGWVCIKALKMESVRSGKRSVHPCRCTQKRTHAPVYTGFNTEWDKRRVSLQSWLLILKWCCWAGDRERGREWTVKQGHHIQETETVSDKVKNRFKLNHLSLSFIFTKNPTEASMPCLQELCY